MPRKSDPEIRAQAGWRRISRSHRNLTDALLWFGTQPRQRVLVPTAQALPRTFTRVVDQAAG